MSSLELSILKVEGLEAGTFCRVLLDNEELLIKNSHFSIPKQGILSFEFSKNKSFQGGVLFSSDLLATSSYQYIPIYNPSIYIDNFLNEIDAPRFLLIQTMPSLECSVISSRCESNMLEESFETAKMSRFKISEQKNENLKVDLDYFKKLALNEKNISQAKIEDLTMYIEANNFKNLMIQKNKEFVIKDLQTIKEKTNSELIDFETQGLFQILLKKIKEDSLLITELIKEKNELAVKVKELEFENKNIKMDSMKQEILLKGVMIKENSLRKENETKKLFEKLVQSKVSDSLKDQNSTLKNRLEEYQMETLNFKEKFENTEKSYKVLKECLLGPNYNQVFK